MKTYIVYYSCPFCPSPDCGSDPESEANEMCYAESKREAREWFNGAKMCRWMKVTRIEEDGNA